MISARNVMLSKIYWPERRCSLMLTKKSKIGLNNKLKSMIILLKLKNWWFVCLKITPNFPKISEWYKSTSNRFIYNGPKKFGDGYFFRYLENFLFLLGILKYLDQFDWIY